MTPARRLSSRFASLQCPVRSIARRTALVAVAATLLLPASAAAVVATWIGGDGDYDDAFNWDVGVVPLNNGTSYDVVINGNGVDVTYDAPFPGAADSLSLGSGVTFLTDGAGRSFSVGSTVANDASLIAEDKSVLVLGGGSLDRSDLIARKGFGGFGGASLSTTVSSWTGTNGFNLDRDFVADGAGTVLDLSSFTTLERNGGNVSSQLFITATDGGRIDLSGITAIDDNASGTNGGVVVKADDADSVVDLANVTALTEADLTVRDGGEIKGQLETLGGRSSLVKRSTGLIDLSALTNADDATLVAEDGATLDLGTASIDRADLIARKGFQGAGGATLTTAVTSWTGTNGFALSRDFTADGPGSVLDLSSLTTIERNGGNANSRLDILATDGGLVDLTGITAFADNVSGINGRIGIEASDDGSLVDLRNVTALSSADVTIDDEAVVLLDRLGAFEDGTVLLRSNATAAADLRVADSFFLGDDGVVDVAGSTAAVVAGLAGGPVQDASLTVAVGGRLTGTGTIIGDLVNDGGVVGPGASPGSLSVDGDYAQTLGAILDVEIGGTEQGVDFDLLDIAGQATLAGDVEVSLFGGFLPGNGASFVFLDAADGIIGMFDAVFCTNCDGTGVSFTLTHGLDSVTLVATAAPIPLPAAAWLLAPALGVLVVKRRRC